MTEREAARNIACLRRSLDSPESDCTLALRQAREAELTRLLRKYPNAEGTGEKNPSEFERAVRARLGVEPSRPHPAACAMSEAPASDCNCWCRGELHGLGLFRRDSLLERER